MYPEKMNWVQALGTAQSLAGSGFEGDCTQCDQLFSIEYIEIEDLGGAHEARTRLHVYILIGKREKIGYFGYTEAQSQTGSGFQRLRQEINWSHPHKGRYA